MKSRPATLAEDRALTPMEAELIHWLLSHSDVRAQSFLPQLKHVRVAGRCSCGCASINLSVDGVSHYGVGGMETLCEYQWQAKDGALFGVFAFACNDLLAGIDLWSIDGRSIPVELPPLAALEPM